MSGWPVVIIEFLPSTAAACWIHRFWLFLPAWACRAFRPVCLFFFEHHFWLNGLIVIQRRKAFHFQTWNHSHLTSIALHTCTSLISVLSSSSRCFLMSSHTEVYISESLRQPSHNQLSLFSGDSYKYETWRAPRETRGKLPQSNT